MKLDEYMKQHDLDDKGFGELVGVNRMQVFRYRHGRAKPRDKVMQKIYDETGGLVTANDFFSPSQQTPH